MTTFAEILNEANQLTEMADIFATRYVSSARGQMKAPIVVIPATDSKQGEEKAPTAKPNGITR
jgi:hypothetical protein